MAKNGEGEILEWLGTQKGAMLALLEDIVNIDGGSYDKAGVDAVGARLRTFLEGEGIACEIIANEKFGDALRATVGGPSNSAIMLMGHRDTVFPKGEPTRRPFRIENGNAYGPGVADMKAGLVMNAFVLAAFQKFGGSPAPLVGLFTSDEEIGSPACRPIIEAEARRARAVFNSEPGRPSGNVVSGRKGGVFMKMEITGKAAHSGGNFTDGISAIEELARKTIALHAMTDLTRGTTVNVGLVSGGQTVNTVAPWAKCEIDLRYVTPADREDAMGKIDAHRRDRERAGHQREARDRGRVQAAGRDAGFKAPVRALCVLRQGPRPQGRGRVHRRLRGLRLHGRRRHADHLRGRTGGRQGAHAGRIYGGGLARPARADLGARGGKANVGVDLRLAGLRSCLRTGAQA